MAKSEKLYILYTLEILKRYSDENHRLTQQQIMDYMQRDYEVKPDRKSVKNNIDMLQEMFTSDAYSGYEIVRGNKKEGVYIRRTDISDQEVSFLIQTIENIHFINKNGKNKLIRAVSELGSATLQNGISILSGTERTKSNGIYGTLKILEQCILHKKKVSFSYGTKDIHNKWIDDEKGTRNVSPYRIIMHNNNYYLIGKGERLTSYRLDRIAHAKKTEESAEEFQPCHGFSSVKDLDKLDSLAFMSIGDWKKYAFITEKEGWIISQVMDWFGGFVEEVRDVGKYYKFFVNSTDFSMKHWALMYSDIATIVEPNEFAKEIQSTLQENLTRYNAMVRQ